ncbi:hypothetical protein BT69DRAFT_356038 [Atractiella rhizophila]|nr:hypothetical protein BT69DRAFT_356038 [Atractiella rhizophila]
MAELNGLTPQQSGISTARQITDGVVDDTPRPNSRSDRRHRNTLFGNGIQGPQLRVPLSTCSHPQFLSSPTRAVNPFMASVKTSRRPATLEQPDFRSSPPPKVFSFPALSTSKNSQSLPAKKVANRTGAVYKPTLIAREAFSNNNWSPSGREGLKTGARAHEGGEEDVFGPVLRLDQDEEVAEEEETVFVVDDEEEEDFGLAGKDAVVVTPEEEVIGEPQGQGLPVGSTTKRRSLDNHVVSSTSRDEIYEVQDSPVQSSATSVLEGVHASPNGNSTAATRISTVTAQTEKGVESPSRCVNNKEKTPPSTIKTLTYGEGFIYPEDAVEQLSNRKRPVTTLACGKRTSREEWTIPQDHSPSHAHNHQNTPPTAVGDEDPDTEDEQFGDVILKEWVKNPKKAWTRDFSSLKNKGKGKQTDLHGALSQGKVERLLRSGRYRLMSEDPMYTHNRTSYSHVRALDKIDSEEGLLEEEAIEPEQKGSRVEARETLFTRLRRRRKRKWEMDRKPCPPFSPHHMQGPAWMKLTSKKWTKVMISGSDRLDAIM